MTRALRDHRNSHRSLPGPLYRLSAGPSSLFQYFKVIWLMGVVILLPMDFIKLPLNTTPVDVWILLALPTVWLLFGHGIQSVSLGYLVAMWLILLASFISIFVALAPMNSFIVILKEVYVFVWFFTIAAVMCALNARDRRRLLVVWCGAVFMHGVIIIAQFLSPGFWRFTASLAGSVKEFEIYRPSGLFVNANSAALFQLLGFVPLMLVSPSPRAAVTLGMLLLPSMLVTGSMGAALALVTGVAVAMAALALNGHMGRVVVAGLQLVVISALLVGLLYYVTSHNARYQVHFERIFLGRAERSSGGRFDLWQRGFDVFLYHGAFLWGVGPENFREVDGHGNQLHSDFMAFLVERGLLGVLGLVLLAGVALGRSASLIWMYHKHPDRAGLAGFIFLGAMVAALVESLTHQVFHFRELWLVLALQEAMAFRMLRVGHGAERGRQSLPFNSEILGVTKWSG